MASRLARKELDKAGAPAALASGAGITRLLSDDRLAQRAVRGDKRAFAVIFGRYHQSLYRYCLAIVGNSQDAQDALQNTMVKVLAALPGEKRQIQLKPWLHRIAHNESIELLRRRRDTRQLDPELGALRSGTPEEEAASRERLRRLISDLGELPKRQHGALVMRELAGLDFAEIGIALGTSSEVARQALYEARLSLRQMDEGREMSCMTVTKTLSDGDGRIARRRDLRAHLRTCASCRGFREEVEGRERDLAALSPLPAVAATGLLRGLLGSQGAENGGLATVFGGEAAKSLGASAALKGAAAVTAAAAIGIGAADRSGSLIDVWPPGGGDGRAQAAREGQPGRAHSALARTRWDSAATTPTVRSAEPARGVSQVGALPTTKPGVEKVAAPGSAGTNAESVPTHTSRGNSAANLRDKGHEGQLPSASTHGQQMAASKKSSGQGHARPTDGHPAHPSAPAHPAHPAQPEHPEHPAHPSNPSDEKKLPPAPDPPAHGNADNQIPGLDLASPGQGAGKKP